MTNPDPNIAAMQAAHPYLGPFMNECLSCVAEVTSTIPNPPQNVGFRVGTEVIHDLGLGTDTCCQGIAFVMLGDVYPSSERFPHPDIVRQASACAPASWTVYVKIGIIRCIPAAGIEPLSQQDWNAAAVQNVYDTMALARIGCCIRDFVYHQSDLWAGMSMILDRQTQTNPNGGCIERSFPIAVQMPNCECR